MRPAMLRRKGLQELARRVEANELKPDFGPGRIDPASGCVLIGARRPLIAFNVNLATDDLAVAQGIASVVRFPLASRGLVQVSMNIEDWTAAPLDEIVARIDAEAARLGVTVNGCELVGLMPESAAARGGAALGLDSLDESRLLEPRLSRLAP